MATGLTPQRLLVIDKEKVTAVWIALLVTGQVLGLILVAAFALRLYRRGQATHAQLAQESFDRALASDRRADQVEQRVAELEQAVPVIHRRLDKIDLRQRIETARLMVLEAQAHTLVSDAAATRLSLALRQMADDANRR